MNALSGFYSLYNAIPPQPRPWSQPAADPYPKRRAMKPGSIPILLHDAAAVALAWWLGYLLRFNFAVPEVYAQGFARTLPVVLPVYLVVFALARVERGLWRFAGLPDVERIVAAVAQRRCWRWPRCMPRG